MAPRPDATKCISWHMVRSRGIEASPAQLQIMLEMCAPESVKEVKHLGGKLAAPSHFILKASDKVYSFFKLLAPNIMNLGRHARPSF